ncbi:hypothetical protein CMQ_1988 [Grosmannia clavigera kw1407]|uniref:Uncharacterized protein n=1 Tax=Grosmannia clavigera (strain kw1407 / UAMH 11150) TaxID=655863 RepID=F0XNA2_GROCL|nr:uncharacterized protein CMQ_1988 [Grosmannia clavigera kw1407]EFX00907.1 hypothetical protein CMQ_1988 [Grosmannia clavigera kw1407]
MSSSIAIPTASSSGGGPSHHHHLRRHHRHQLRSIDAGVGSSSGPHASTAMSPSSSTSSAHSPASSLASSSDYSGSPSKSSSVLSQSPLCTRKQRMFYQRRPSLLSSAISKQEAQVINIGDPDGPPRLISYLSSSQGFTWNPEIFVPSYIDFDYTPLENRREPVHEIVLSDEEIADMFPK